ncbi:MAG: hypothetical protein GXO93_05980 [FCB group bacterium]|nr:hypothetical protein [FCB group bacterium]
MKTNRKILTPKKKFIVYHLPTIIYAIVIILVSSIPNLKTPSLRFLAFDKLAHFFEYAIFAFLIFRSFSNLFPSNGISRTFFFSAFFLSVFAFADEYHQRYIPGRFFDYYDLLTDFCGAFLVLIFLSLRFKFKRKELNQKQLLRK